MDQKLRSPQDRERLKAYLKNELRKLDHNNRHAVDELTIRLNQGRAMALEMVAKHMLEESVE